MGKPFPGPDSQSLLQLRGPATRRLRLLDERGELTSEHVRIIAASLGVAERTVWRWLEQARKDGRCERKINKRFSVTDDLRVLLAFHGGNASALHRELVKAAEAGGPPAPSLPTLHRALRRDLNAGQRAGLVRGIRARRDYDPRMRRPKGPDAVEVHKNLVWEGDHLHSAVEVDIGGKLIVPWVTWFIDCATDAICGLAVTPGCPGTASILAALRSAIMRDGVYGPFGGLPGSVRVDKGADFVGHVVRDALSGYAVPVGELPGYHPELKGTVENLNGCAKKMLFKTLPRYTGGAKRLNGKPIDPDAPALTFEGFTAELWGWVNDWNRLYPKKVLGGRTPERAWREDAWPVDDVPAGDLRLMMLADDGRDRVINDGVSWKNRLYFGPWMTGMVGTRVRLRYMPHHDHEVEVFDAVTGHYLGSAELSDQTGPERRAEVFAARATQSRQLERDLKRAAQLRRQRYAAVTVPQPARRLGALTEAEATAELNRPPQASGGPQHMPRSTLVPLPAPDDGWVLPVRPVPIATTDTTTATGEGAALS